MVRVLKKMVQKARQFLEWENIVWNDPTDYKISLLDRLKYAVRGFSVNEFIWYRLKENDYREYISEWERLRSRNINGDYKFILDNKLIFEEVFEKYTRVPVNYAWVSEGRIYGLHGLDIEEKNVLEFLHNHPSVLKWLDRGGGKGTYVFTNEDGVLLTNGKERSTEEVQQLFCRNGNAILCEYIAQSDFAASLYPYTTNTIRIVCAKKKNEKKAKIIMAVQRIGCEASIPVDNLSSGGMTSEINLATGQLGYCIAKLGKIENRMKPFVYHPDTGTQIQGKVIPGWDKLIQDIEELTNHIPYLNFVAWDILLTEEGFCVIEGNASSGCNLFQMEKGVRNTALGEIYRSYGIIK